MRCPEVVRVRGKYNCLRSTTADGGDYLDPIAVVEALFAVAAARHDFAVALDGDFLADQGHRVE